MNYVINMAAKCFMTALCLATMQIPFFFHVFTVLQRKVRPICAIIVIEISI